MGQVLDTCCGGGADASADVVPGLVGTVGPQIPASAIKSLKDMGFDEVAARNALEACNGNLEQATQLLSAAEPEEPMAPLAPPRSDQAPEKVATLVSMGFTEQQATDALDGCSGNVERAAAWWQIRMLKFKSRRGDNEESFEIEYLMASTK